MQGSKDEALAPQELLTQQEAIERLRLGDLGVKRPEETLRYLRRTRQLGYVKVAGKVLIPSAEVERYIVQHTVKPMLG